MAEATSFDRDPLVEDLGNRFFADGMRMCMNATVCRGPDVQFAEARGTAVNRLGESPSGEAPHRWLEVEDLGQRGAGSPPICGCYPGQCRGGD